MLPQRNIALLILYTVICSAGKTERYKTLRYHTMITGTDHELKWDFSSRKFFFELTVRSTDPVMGFGFSDHGETSNADFMMSWVDEDHERHIQDMWTDAYSIMHADVHQSYEIDGVKRLVSDSIGQRSKYGSDLGLLIRFSRERKSCDLQDYHVDTGTTHILMFTVPYIMGAPDMINASAFNMTVTRVQLLKSQVPLPPLPDDLQIIDVRQKQVVVPASETTYWCSVHMLPIIRIKSHIIQYEGLIDHGSHSVVHHIEVYGCQTSPKMRLPLYSGPCDSKPQSLEACKKVIGAWAMGADAFRYPLEAGIPIGGPANSMYAMLEVHYNNPEKLPNLVDSSGIRFSVTSQLREFDAAIMEVGVSYDSRQSIPPKQDAFFLEGVCSEKCTIRGLPDQGITVFASQLHTHLTGRKIRTMHIRDGIQLPDLNADKHYSSHFQEIRILQQPVKVQPGDALITECEYSTRRRENITLGGFAMTEEMCVNYLHYYPKTSLEVCKSAISQNALQRFFTMMAYYMKAGTDHYHSISENFEALRWNPVNSQLLQWFYDTMPIDAECHRSDGTTYPGQLININKPRVWYSSRYNARQPNDCDDEELERFYRTNKQ